MRLFLTSLLGIIFLFSFLKIRAQKRDLISNTILTASDSTPITGVHILNINSRQVVVSDAEGEFYILASQTDTIIITSIGFKTLKYFVKSIPIIIYLKQVNYDLVSHTVLPYKNFKEFKEAFANIELPDTTLRINSSIYLSKEELRAYDGSNGFVGGISGLLSHFNKYIQDKNKYEKLMNDYNQHSNIILKKFNSQLVKQVTNLTNEKEIRIFMEYCNFTDHFIKYSYALQLEKQIVHCYEEYISLSYNR